MPGIVLVLENSEVNKQASALEGLSVSSGKHSIREK